MELFNDGCVRATYNFPDYVQKKNTIVITFQNINGSIWSKGFAEDFLTYYGIESICFSLEGKSFYQTLDLKKFKEIVECYVVGKKVVLYGASLGGYAAIYYSGAVDGQAIAF